MTAGGPRSSLQLPVVADIDRKVSYWQRGELFRGVDVDFSLRSKPLDFGDRSIGKLVQMIKVDGQWDAETMLHVGTVEHPEGTVDWFHDAPMVQQNYFPNEREAPYFVLEFYGSKPAYITGIEFYGVPGGVWF
jgi:hypothetical protein